MPMYWYFCLILNELEELKSSRKVTKDERRSSFVGAKINSAEGKIIYRERPRRAWTYNLRAHCGVGRDRKPLRDN